MRGVSEKLERASFLPFIMDGSTDISGEEQESMFVRSARNGVVSINFLQISSPNSTSSEHLFEHVVDVFKQTGLQTELDKGTSCLQFTTFNYFCFQAMCLRMSSILKYCCPHQFVYALFKIRF